MHKLLTGDVWSQVRKMLTKGDSITAAISYVTTQTIPLKRGDILICDASHQAISNGVTSADSLKHYNSKHVTIYSVKGLHSKVLVSNRCAVIGSANLSENSKKHLVEASLFTTEDSVIAQTRAFIDPYISDDTYLLNDDDIEKLRQIKVDKRGYTPTGIPKHRSRKFGGDFWIVTTRLLKHNRYDDEIERNEKEIASERSIPRSHLTTFTWPLKSNFARNSKLGDIIIEKHREQRNTFIYSPATIVRVKKKSNCMIYFLRYIKTNNYISWTEFEKKINPNKLNRQIVKNSNRKLNKDEYIHLKSILK